MSDLFEGPALMHNLPINNINHLPFNMFDGSSFPQPLEEDIFELWLEKGRESKIGYHYLLVVWDAFDEVYLPVYAEKRETMHEYEPYQSSTGRESLVAAYNLYSESRVG